MIGPNNFPYNPPNSHFVMPIAAFEKIAIWKAGVLPIQYRRFFVAVLISNVAAAGDAMAVKVKGTATGWLRMGRFWGQN
ncbi:hypothetical protein IEQ34_015627 [Dendrobium chrysotoxum]|uniref:Expansin-like CBD domain-containing protein n=1 Tax=Dendrobium chrysotoxum TaxID=161865 RepID=A0AAV7G0J8_DENCH|nr:hypothetical protein IEQ34_015627 [Dendrobium chrysotoxum]